MKCVTCIAALAVLLACVGSNDAACGYKVSFGVESCGMCDSEMNQKF